MFAISSRTKVFSRKHRNRQRGLRVETLEQRQLLAAEITGTFYEDVDSNGVKSGPDNTLSGWTAFVDIDKNGVLNNLPDGTSEPFAVANSGGDYMINMTGRPSGVYRVAEILQAGWTPTAPVSRDVSFIAGQSTNKIDFFNFAGGTIQGAVWEDLNEDGIRDVDPVTGEFTDPGLAGWTVFLDLRASGGGGRNQMLDPGEPFTVTDALGNYSFTDLPAGDYEVTEVQPVGWDVPPGFDIQQTAGVVALGTATADFANFSVLNGSIEGTVWNDVNGNGDRDVDLITGLPTEPGLEGWTVYIDANSNGALDATEQSTTTDVDGKYYFVSVLEGTHRIKEILPPNWSPAPGYAAQQIADVIAGEKTKDVDFANFTVLNGAITGTVWNDANRDGVRNSVFGGGFSDPGLEGWTVYLDMNRNGAFDDSEPTALTDVDGVYTFPDLQIGEYEVIEVVPSGWETAPSFGDNHNVRVYSGATSTAPDFANFNLSTLVLGSVSGSVWDDVNGNGVRDTTPTTEPGSAGWTVFADINNNRVADPTEPQAITTADGTYTISGVTPGTTTIVILARSGWHATSPITGSQSLTLKNGENVSGVNFGEQQTRNSSLSGTVFADANKNGVRDASERGLAGIVIYLDINGNSVRDTDEPSTTTSEDLFFTPSVNEAGTYSFTHLGDGSYVMRQEVPAVLSATPASELQHSAAIVSSLNVSGIDFADVYRPNEIHGVKFDDLNGNGMRDAGELGIGGTTVFIDLDRDDILDAGEPITVTLGDGSYEFLDLSPGAYVVREVLEAGHYRTTPDTVGGILWPAGVSNPAVGNVTPLIIQQSLAQGESYLQNVTITLPSSGGLTNLVDVFLLFDDTGSFTFNSPIVRGAFPTIMTDLQASLPGVDLGFGVGRFEEYGNFASEYSTGRPFVLNQPIVASTTTGYQTAIQAALDRTAPGYGGDQPETDIEALYQLVTGLGFDGNNNGSVLDSGAAGLASTQLTPGNSGDVPSFASFTVDTTSGALPSVGTIGGGGFRAGALPVVLLATDTGFAYQPKGETSITGINGLSLPISDLTQTSRQTTPFGSGAGLQETITGLNALGALVIGLGTNAGATTDPRLGLESIAKLTGATNQTTTTIANGTADPIAPGDPFYFQISSGFASSVSAGITNAIQNAVTNVAVNITVQASDPRVHIINHSGTRVGVGAGQTAAFDIEFVGDGVPHRFDLQFVREGTNVVLGSIPVVLGTPIPGDGYQFDDLDEGEIELEDHFGDSLDSALPPNVAPSFVAGADQIVAEDAGLQTVIPWATSISPGPASEASQVVDFIVTNDNPSLFSVAPAISADGILTFTSAPNASGAATIAVVLHDNGGKANGGQDTSVSQQFLITVTAVNDTPVAVNDSYSVNQDSALTISAAGVLSNDSDVDGNALTAAQVVTAAHGTVALAADGSFTYTPSAGFVGTDSFTYVANDGTIDSNIATVTITVNAVNHAPVAMNDSYSVNQDSTLTIAAAGVLGNDTDADGNALTAAQVVTAAHGTVALAANGSFTYTPTAGFMGTDSFTYVANDGTIDSNIATITITVNAVNHAPVAVNDSYSTDEDTTLTIAGAGVLGNDADADSAALNAVLGTAPANGTLTLNTNGSFTYTPYANFNGSDSFTYKANDGALDSNVATVNITVNPVNDAPDAVNDAYTSTQGTDLVIAAPGVLGNDSDVDSTTLTAAIEVSPANGNVTLSANGSFTYTANLGFTGTDTFTYRASDGATVSNAAIVTINVAPQPVEGGAKFFVVDASNRRTYQYDAGGNAVENNRLNKEDESPRGIAASADGSVKWVVDQKGEIFVYDAQNKLIGSWEVKDVDKPEGVTVHGKDLWVVDREEDRVYFFKNGALRRSGGAKPTSSFNLDRGNRNPMDIVTDGTHIWVVDDARKVDKVFRYSVGGSFEGSWAIDSDNAQPTGLTIDPNDVNHVWIVDSRSDAVYQYDSAAARTSGQQSANLTFALAAANRNPQGIADPLSVALDTTTGVHWESHVAKENDGRLHWENSKNELDVNDDGSVSASDTLALINHLSLNESTDVALLDLNAMFLDSNADGRVSAADALAVINGMNRLTFTDRSDLIDRAIGQLDDDDDDKRQDETDDDLDANLGHNVTSRLK